MIIGLDFDNTIVSYDALFCRIARERRLIPQEFPANKKAVRDHLRATGREEIWTEMQGEVYGGRIGEAEIMPGVANFILACRENDIGLRIISHKTRFPYLGTQYDLHAAARGWLAQHGFFDVLDFGVAEEIFFELTKEAKLARIKTSGCTDFIDDLCEILSDPAFPSGVRRYHFDPAAPESETTPFDGLGDWPRLTNLVLPEPTWMRSARSMLNVASGKKFIPLRGGANNRVFSCDSTFLIKRYFAHPDDPRDRFATEQKFYTYLSSCGVTQTPRALSWDASARVGVFSFIDGASPPAVTGDHVDAAIEFVRDLNRLSNKTAAGLLSPASEACFSLDAHLAAVARRVDALRLLSPDESVLDHEARGFVQDILVPAWKEVVAQINEHTSAEDRATELNAVERCVSPSDFGFHNTLVKSDGRVVFFDFEYAGWDDPAKLVSDFFCQPEHPVPEVYFSAFVAGVANALFLPRESGFERRCQLLFPLYQIKWSCILLNEFTANGRRRRTFSLGETAAAERRERQLRRARELLNRLRIAA